MMSRLILRLLLTGAFHIVCCAASAEEQGVSDETLSLELLEYLVDIECASNTNCIDPALFEYQDRQNEHNNLQLNDAFSELDGDEVDD